MTPALLEALIVAGIKYGPQFITDVKNLFNKQNVTIADVEAVFADVKPYSSFNIPAVAPVAVGASAVKVLQ